jgi:NTE family protein
MPTKKKTTVSLVLGSGGARGLAHIGVIHELQDRGYEIRSISGCSIGALIGGVFAAGKLNDFERWICAITKIDMVTLLDISWGKDGLVKGDKIISTLIDLVGDKTIEELPIPFTAIAADVKNEKEVWINSGRLFDAIRASISLPLFFTPVKYKEVYLIDGGVLNPVPIAPTFSDDTDITIAVNLGGPLNQKDEMVEDRPPSESKSSPLRQKVDRFFSELQNSVKGSSEKNWGAYDVANEAFDAMQSTIARQKLAAYPPDIVIEIARNACGTLEFDRASQMIELGRSKAQEKLSKVRNRGGSHQT